MLLSPKSWYLPGNGWIFGAELNGDVGEKALGGGSGTSSLDVNSSYGKVFDDPSGWAGGSVDSGGRTIASIL